ncbi:hypothetical protein ACEXQD_06610 [Herbiconiux sp. P15]|uniref:hypothetical protein n=1 Tax=Herbiconiux liukaitaii TaxID=3342799 RepID=UPI0035B72D36
MTTGSSNTQLVEKKSVGPRAGVILVGTPLLILVAVLNPAFVAVFPAGLMNVIVFALVMRRLAPLGASPSVYFAAYLSLIGLAGFAFTNALVGSGGTGGVDVALTDDLLVSGSIMFFCASTVVLLFAAITRGRPQTSEGGDGTGVLDLGDLGRFSAPILLVGLAEFVILIGFLGPAEFLSRPDRLVGRDSSFEAVFQMVALGAVVAMSIVAFSRRGAVRVFAVVLLTAYAAYFISLGTRRLALVPLLILIGYILARRGKVPVVGTIVTAVVALILLSLPLYFRGLPFHGLIPHLEGLGTFVWNAEVFATSANNVLAGFKISTLTAFTQPAIPIDALWVSINPMTGDTAGWYEIARTLRLNQFTPYSAIGELGNYGPVVFICVFAGIGLLLGIVQKLNDILFREQLWKLVGVAALGLTFVFVIQFAQYNLRSNLRYLYLMLAIQVAAVVIIRIRRWSRERNTVAT